MNLRPLYQTASAASAVYRILYLVVLTGLLVTGRQIHPPNNNRRK